MKILYCRVGWMESYKGSATERPQAGGKYNQENIGYEVYNYLGYEGEYYGFVEPGVNNTIHVERLCGDKKAELAEDVLIIWVAKKSSGGQYIVGWYRNAMVYRTLQDVPIEAMSIRKSKKHNVYNIYSKNVYLLGLNDRKFLIKGMGHSNIWYGNSEIDCQVFEYIQDYEKQYNNRIGKLDEKLSDITGGEREAIVKIRINQDKFRDSLIKKYNGKCCLCGVDYLSMLVASHIKPWVKSDKYEKLDIENGLLLCPNHDKLFDSGLISFDSKGKIMISSKLDKNNQIFLNVNNDYEIKMTDENASYIKYHRDNIFVE